MFRKLLKFPKHKRRLMKLNLVEKTSASLLRQPHLIIKPYYPYGFFVSPILTVGYLIPNCSK